MTVVVVEPDPAAPDPAAPDVLETTKTSVDAETTQVAVDAAVAIAQINAERDIVLAEIEAETRTKKLDETVDADPIAMQAELSQCRTMISDLTLQVSDLTTALSAIQDKLKQTPLPPSRPLESESGVSMPASRAAPDPAPDPAPEPVKKVRRSRWI